MGTVRNAATKTPMDSARVYAKWVDVTLDTTARPSNGSVDLDPDSSGWSLFPMSASTTRYHVVVRDLQGRPVTSARARILGRVAVRSNEAGVVTLDSIASGTRMLEVSARGTGLR
jgi:hypothetical protein